MTKELTNPSEINALVDPTGALTRAGLYNPLPPMIKNNKYFEVTITPAHGGFDEFQCSEINGEAWDFEADLLQEAGDIIVLGRDELPDGIEDIRGRIHNEPQTIFAIVHDEHHVSYYGIVEVDIGIE